MEFEEYLNDFFDYKMSSIFTAIPAIVLEVLPEQARVKVQPIIRQLFKDDTALEYPPIIKVPLVYPSSKKSAFTFPVEKGDTVLLVFSQRGIDTFKAGTGSFTTPLDFRTFDVKDAVAIPGLMPFGSSINNPSKRSLPHSTSDVVVAHNIGTANEAEVRIKPSGEIQLQSKLKVTIDSPETELKGNVTVEGSINATDTITSATDVVGGTISLVSHVHTGVTPGGGSTGPAV